METPPRGTTGRLETVAVAPPYALSSVLRRMVAVFAPMEVLGTSLATSLLPVPPPLPEGRTGCSALSRLALVTAQDRCLMPCLLGKLGRWS